MISPCQFRLHAKFVHLKLISIAKKLNNTGFFCMIDSILKIISTSNIFTFMPLSGKTWSISFWWPNNDEWQTKSQTRPLPCIEQNLSYKKDTAKSSHDRRQICQSRNIVQDVWHLYGHIKNRNKWPKSRFIRCH